MDPATVISLCKENIQPLRHGRNAMQLGTALRAQEDVEVQQLLLQEKQMYEDAIKNYDGDDPLENWYEYILWVEQSYPKSGHESHIGKLLQQCLAAFEKDTKYHQDRRYIRLWINYISMQKNPLELYQLLYNNGIGTMVADMYRAWAFESEQVDDYKRADEIYIMGINARAEPRDELIYARDNFQLAVGRKTLGCVEERNEIALSEQRQAFSSLRAIKSGKRVTSIRTGHRVRDYLPGVVAQSASQQQMQQSTKTNSRISIYEDDAGRIETRSASILDHVPIEDTIHKENTIKPGPWSNSSRKQPLIPSDIRSAFKVHEDGLDDNVANDKLRLFPNHTSFFDGSKYPEHMNVPVFIPEVISATITKAHYPKDLVYANNVDRSMEEIRAEKYLIHGQNIENNCEVKDDKLQLEISHNIVNGEVNRGHQVNMNEIVTAIEQRKHEEEEIAKSKLEQQRRETEQREYEHRQCLQVEKERREAEQRGLERRRQAEQLELERHHREAAEMVERQRREAELERQCRITELERQRREAELERRRREVELERQRQEAELERQCREADLERQRIEAERIEAERIESQRMEAELSRQSKLQSSNYMHHSSNETINSNVEQLLGQSLTVNTKEAMSVVQELWHSPSDNTSPLMQSPMAHRLVDARSKLSFDIHIDSSMTQQHALSTSRHHTSYNIQPYHDQENHQHYNPTYNHPPTQEHHSSPYPNHGIQNPYHPYQVQQQQQQQQQQQHHSMQQHNIRSLQSHHQSPQMPSPHIGQHNMLQHHQQIPQSPIIPTHSQSPHVSQHLHTSHLSHHSPSQLIQQSLSHQMSPQQHQLQQQHHQQHQHHHQQQQQQEQLHHHHHHHQNHQLQHHQSPQMHPQQHHIYSNMQQNHVGYQQSYSMMQPPPPPPPPQQDEQKHIHFASYIDPQLESNKAYRRSELPYIKSPGMNRRDLKFLENADNKENAAAIVGYNSGVIDENKPDVENNLYVDESLGISPLSGVNDSCFTEGFRGPLPSSTPMTNQFRSSTYRTKDMSHYQPPPQISHYQPPPPPPPPHEQQQQESEIPPPPPIITSGNEPEDKLSVIMESTREYISSSSGSCGNTRTTQFGFTLSRDDLVPIKEQHSTNQDIESTADVLLTANLSHDQQTLRPQIPHMHAQSPRTMQRNVDHITTEIKNSCDLRIPFNLDQESTNSENKNNVAMDLQYNEPMEEVEEEEFELPTGDINPFDKGIISGLLRKIRFPQSHHSDGYARVNTNLNKFVPSSVISLGTDAYEVEKCLGKGTYGTVYKTFNSQTGQSVALKTQKPAWVWEFYIAREIKARLKNPHMLRGFMDVTKCYIANNGSILVSEFSKYGTLLAVTNQWKINYGKPLTEPLAIFFTIEMLQIVEYLHKCQIIHGDIKPDNFLLMHLPTEDVRPTIQLIDYGCSIDMSLFPEGTKFTQIIKTEDFTCIEMQTGRPWTYQTDLYCLAASAHCLLFGTYMRTVRTDDGWFISTKMPRYVQKAAWQSLFTELLNIESCDKMPNLSKLRNMLDEVLAKVSGLDMKLRGLSNMLNKR